MSAPLLSRRLGTCPATPVHRSATMHTGNQGTPLPVVSNASQDPQATHQSVSDRVALRTT